MKTGAWFLLALLFFLVLRASCDRLVFLGCCPLLLRAPSNIIPVLGVMILAEPGCDPVEQFNVILQPPALHGLS